MERTQEAGQVLIDSIYLLGISPATVSREYGCTVARDMFLQPNQKGLNTMLYIIFERIKGREAFRKEIKGAWPIKDSVHQRDFNKIIHRLVMEMSQAGHMPKYLAANLLQGFRQLSGSRLTALLCYLAAFALAKHPCCSAVQRKFVFQELPSDGAALEPIYRTVRAQNEVQRTELVIALRRMSEGQARWDSAAEALGPEYRSGWQKLRDLTGKDPLTDQTFLLDAAQDSPDSAANEHEVEYDRAQISKAAREAEDLWGGLEAGAAQQEKLRAALEQIVSKATHPHAVDGADLLGTVDNAELLNLPALLQGWKKLLAAASEEGLPETAEVQRLETQNRPITPLLAPEQQEQVTSIRSQHEARLQAQKQLATALQSLLAAAASQKEALSAKLNAALNLAQPQTQCGTESPRKDLIRASYPDQQGGQRKREDALAQPLLPQASKLSDAGKKEDASGAGKGSAALLRAEVAAGAYPTSFAGSICPLKMFTANTVLSVLDPSGPAADFAASFIQAEATTDAGKAAAKEESQQQIERLWQMKQADRKGPVVVPPLAEPLEPGSVSSVFAAPRRLSFSGITPMAGHTTNAISSTHAVESTGKTYDADELSVNDLMSRMSRLRSKV